MTHKIAMRRHPRRGGRAAAAPSRRCGTWPRGAPALETVGLPAVLKPADSGGQRGVFRIETAGDLERTSTSALAESPGREAILEGFLDGHGDERDRGRTRRRGADPDAVRPAPAARVGFGVGWIHVFPASLHSDQLARRRASRRARRAALGLRDGIAFPQLIASPDGGVSVVEVAARIPGGQMADLVRHAVGVDLVELALRFALGEPVPDERRAAAVLAAAGDPLPDRVAGAAADRHA